MIMKGSLNNRILHVYPSLNVYGGAEKILLALHKHFKMKGCKSLIVSFSDFEKIHKNYDISIDEYIKLTPMLFYSFNNNDIIISHHRKTTTLLTLLNLVYKAKIVHVAHNVFDNLKYFTLFPKYNIAVSDAVKKNLIDYFGVDLHNVTTIYNGIEDIYIDSIPNQVTLYKNNKIMILYPARICKVKKQIELVEKLVELPDNIEIHFAGDGEDKNRLLEIIKNKKSFKYIGFLSNVQDIFKFYSFVLLYSEKEGLPTSLIEAIMNKVPCIARNVGGVNEIIIDNHNGYIVNNYEELKQVINNISNLSEEKYNILAENARNHFEKYFRIEDMLNNYYKYILNISERGG